MIQHQHRQAENEEITARRFNDPRFQLFFRLRMLQSLFGRRKKNTFQGCSIVFLLHSKIMFFFFRWHLSRKSRGIRIRRRNKESHQEWLMKRLGEFFLSAPNLTFCGIGMCPKSTITLNTVPPDTRNGHYIYVTSGM